MRKKIMRLLVILISLLPPFMASSQDSLIVRSIDAAASKNYDRINRIDWFLTRDPVVGESSDTGTQVSYHYDKDVLIRIVCSGFNKLGQWGKEYYPGDGELAFIYMSQEYFPDKVRPGAPMSWKNVPTDEYRIYIKNGKLVKMVPDGWTGKVSTLQREFDDLLKWRSKR